MSTIAVDRQEWEQLSQDTERLLQKYEKLVAYTKDLKAHDAQLEEMLAACQTEQRDRERRASLLEKQMEVDPEFESKLRELRSDILRLLQVTETVVSY